MNERLSRDDMIYQFVNHDTMALRVSVSTCLYTWTTANVNMALTGDDRVDSHWMAAVWPDMMYNTVQLLLLLHKYIGWNDVTYLRSQYDRHFAGQHRRTVRS